MNEEYFKNLSHEELLAYVLGVQEAEAEDLARSKAVHEELDKKLSFRSDMTVELVKHSANDLDVVMAAKVSTVGTETRKYNTSAVNEKFIGFLLNNAHGSPFEHSVMTFAIEAPIFVFRELFRHRIASVNEASARYKKMEPIFYVPDSARNLVQEGKPGVYKFVPGSAEQQRVTKFAIEQESRFAYMAYDELLDHGVAREVARMVLPVNLYSSCYFTINSRSLMNLLSLRRIVEGSARPSYPQREIEMVAEKMEAIWAELMPVTHKCFNDNGRVAP